MKRTTDFIGRLLQIRRECVTPQGILDRERYKIEAQKLLAEIDAEREREEGGKK